MKHHRASIIIQSAPTLNCIIRNILALLFVLFFPNSPARADEEILSIQPVYQQTPVWCWAAVGEMVFRHYRIPTINPAGNYQCGIIAGIGGPCAFNCFACVVPAGQLHNIALMIEQYPQLAGQFKGSRVSLSADESHSELETSEIVDEIDSGNPVIAGISPSGMAAYYPGGMSEHVALIVGYRDDANILIVNDPFPFDETGAPNPYTRAGGQRLRRGQYAISYDRFVSRLGWANTIRVSK